MDRIYDIIKRPLVSEKGTNQHENYNQYLFEVSADASKPEIKQAVEKLFSVKVDSVNTLVNRGKFKRLGSYVGRNSNWKKAVVTLKEGQKIEIFKGV